MAGDKRFIEIRKRRPQHRTLVRIEERTKEAKQKAANATDQFIKDYEAQEQKEQRAIEDKIAELQKRKNVDRQQMAIEVVMMQQDLERRKEAKTEQLRQEKKRKIELIETDLKEKVRRGAGPVQAVGGAVAADPAAAGGGDRLLHPPRPRTRRRGAVEVAVRGDRD